jgi:hypothetical protein
MIKYKLGKLPKKEDKRNLPFGKYLKSDIAPAPLTADYSYGLKNWGMMLNDSIGDCTIAAAGHEIESWTQGKEIVPDSIIQKVYSDISGYDPSNGNNDNGCCELDVLNYWNKKEINGDKIGAFSEIDLTKPDQIKQGLYLFNGLYIGIQCPDSAQKQFENNEVWTVVPGATIEGGHAIILVGFDEKYFYGVSWGSLITIDPEFITTYMDEAYAIIDKDYLTGDKTAEGFDIETLVADIKAISDGTYNIDPNIINPQPLPTPTPGPVPQPKKLTWWQKIWKWLFN